MKTKTAKVTKRQVRVVSDPKTYYRMGQVAALFGITRSTIRNREDNGIIDAIPRDGSRARRIPITWVQQWMREGGFPGPNKGDPPIPLPGTLLPSPVDAPETITGNVSHDDRAAATVLPIPVAPEAQKVVDDAPLDDLEYRQSSQRVQRAKDDLESLRVQYEIKQVKKNLLDLDKPGADASTSPVMVELMRQNHALMMRLSEIGKRDGDTTIEKALSIINAVKQATIPVDLSSRPEGQLYAKVTERVLDQVLTADKGAAGGGESGLGSIIGELLPALLGLLSKQPVMPPPPIAPAPAPAELPVVVKESEPALLARSVDVEPLTDAMKGGDELRLIGLLGDLLDAAANLCEASVDHQKAAATIQELCSEVSPDDVRSILMRSIESLGLLAVACGATKASALLATVEGRVWFANVLRILESLYDIPKAAQTARPEIDAPASGG